MSFKLNEEIFGLEEPTRRRFPQETACVVCDKELKRSHKHFW